MEENIHRSLFDKTCVQIIKELTQLKHKRSNETPKTWQKDLNNHFQKDTQMVEKSPRRCSTSLVFREMQMTRMKQHFTSIEWLRFLIKTTSTNEYGRITVLTNIDSNVNGIISIEIVGVPQKTVHRTMAYCLTIP